MAGKPRGAAKDRQTSLRLQKELLDTLAKLGRDSGRGFQEEIRRRLFAALQAERLDANWLLKMEVSILQDQFV